MTAAPHIGDRGNRDALLGYIAGKVVRAGRFGFFPGCGDGVHVVGGAGDARQPYGAAQPAGQQDGKNRQAIKPGLTVDIVLKQDQRSGKRTRGVVKDILTSSAQHPHGIKVRLETGEVGRVQAIIA